MSITTYTTYDEVRAALGVSTDEIEDATLELGVYGMGLDMDLMEVNAGVPAAFATVRSIATPDRTPVQQALFQTVKLFATYAVAKQLASGLAMFAPKDISDGKATVSRFADSPYRDTVSHIGQQYGLNRDRLKLAYATLTGGASDATSQSMLRISSPLLDPVTGQ